MDQMMSLNLGVSKITCSKTWMISATQFVEPGFYFPAPTSRGIENRRGHWPHSWSANFLGRLRRLRLGTVKPKLMAPCGWKAKTVRSCPVSWSHWALNTEKSRREHVLPANYTVNYVSRNTVFSKNVSTVSFFWSPIPEKYSRYDSLWFILIHSDSFWFISFPAMWHGKPPPGEPSLGLSARSARWNLWSLAP